MAKPELGNKHQCQHCGTKFFDLSKTPVVCPKCGTVQQVAATTRMARASVPDDDEEVENETGPELVSLEEAEATEENVDVGGDDDVEIEDDSGDDDDTFLEEEEEDNDDVSGLIDGDVGGDDER